ncbi:MAG: hypothetical protein DRO73_12010 [Candidatus Thorarchaeota archaeon]|nr:MAG: hypothetical protein DRO73_12010 [Candidatus Thorarchaeota archaeon]
MSERSEHESCAAPDYFSSVGFPGTSLSCGYLPERLFMILDTLAMSEAQSWMTYAAIGSNSRYSCTKKRRNVISKHIPKRVLRESALI